MNRAVGRALLIAVLLLAAALRWWQPGLVEFKYDEAHTVGLALDVASGGPFPLTSGGTSVGLDRPAGDVYLLALPLLLGRVEAAVWWTGALGVLAVALTYALGRRVGGSAVGLLASLYMVVNPWLVLYDRKLWSHIQVVFSVALLLLAWEIVVAGRRRAAFWFVIIATLQCLAHVLSLLQVLSWIAALLLAPRRWLNRPWLVGLGVSALMLAPFIAGLVMKTAGASPPAGTGPAMDPVSLLTFSPAQNVAQALTIFGGSGIHALAGLPPQGIHAGATWIGWIVAGLILFGVFISARDLASDGRAAQTAWLLLAWGALPLLALVFAPVVYQQYWTVLLPLPALYFAVGAREAWRRLPTASGYVLGPAVMVLLLGVWIGSYGVLVRSIEAGKGAEAFGVPLQRWEAAVQAAVNEAAATGAAGIRVAVQGVDARYEGEPAAIAALLHGRDDVRLVAPGWPYFALVDPRYESESNVIATEEKRQDGDDLPGVTPGYSLLHENLPTVFLWALDDSGIEEMLARVGSQAWEGQLAAGRPPASVYVVPSRAEVAQAAAEAALALASDAGQGTALVAVDEPLSPVLDALAPGTATVIPPAANDRASAEEAIAALAKSGVRRLVLVEQPSGWWDNGSTARDALESAYRLIGSWPEQIWTLHVYSVPPGQLDPAGVQFHAGPRLEGFAIEGEAALPGGIMILHVAWSAPETMQPDLKVSFQLLGGDGVVKAQVDRELRGSDFDASVASYGLRLPPEIAEGEYQLIGVVYDGKTGARLSTDTSDVAELGSVAVLQRPSP